MKGRYVGGWPRVRIHRFRRPDLFLDRARAFVLQGEAEKFLFLGLGGQGGGSPREWADNCYLATIEDAGDVVACAVCTPPYGVNISRATPSALEALIDDLAQKYGTLPSVRGPEPTVSDFAQCWSSRVGTRARPIMRMRLFEARSVRPPELAAPGVLRTATDHDLGIAEAWAVAFHEEAGTGDPIDPVHTTREQVTDRGQQLKASC